MTDGRTFFSLLLWRCTNQHWLPLYPYLFLVLVRVSSYLVVSNPFCIFVSYLGTYLSVFFHIKDRFRLNNSALPLVTAPVTPI